MIKKIKIGYFSYSSNLNHPADRRRLNFYAQNSNTEIVVNPSKDSKLDALLATQKYNLIKIKRKFPKIPLIYDLIEGYLIPDSKYKDFFHGIFEGTIGDFGLPIQKNSEYYKQFCSIADHIICSTPEQLEIIKNYNTNISIILDSHEEFKSIKFENKKYNSLNVFWEGQPYTVSSLNKLERLLLNNDLVNQINIVTDFEYRKFSKIPFKNKTRNLLTQKIRNQKNINLIHWNNETISDYAKKSNIQFIPLDTTNMFQLYKPENRLLISWKLGLPALVSPIYSYMRVVKNMDFDSTCENLDDWFQKASRIQKEKDLAESIVIQGQNYISEHHNKDILLTKWEKVINQFV